jgi:hypothetical protein
LRPWGLTRDTIQHWQALARLICRVPGLQPYDARILVACGVTDPEQLLETSFSELRERVRKLASSADGRAILLSGTELELSRISDWLHVPSADKPLMAEGRSPRSAPTRNARSASVRSSHTKQIEPSRTDDSQLLAKVWAHDGRLAARFAQLGVTTVTDFLEADPESLATRLQMARVTGSTVRRWQQQADLLSRVPQLTGWHLRILAAVGVASIETLAKQVPQEMCRHLQQFRRTREGQRLFAGTRELSLADLKAWVQTARSVRTRAAA